jgi:hypothetical protein
MQPPMAQPMEQEPASAGFSLGEPPMDQPPEMAATGANPGLV